MCEKINPELSGKCKTIQTKMDKNAVEVYNAHAIYNADLIFSGENDKNKLTEDSISLFNSIKNGKTLFNEYNKADCEFDVAALYNEKGVEFKLNEN